ncbi:hypothetical protein SAMN04487886_10471 [Clostridium sp. DSM 8431]|uniref:hypothetical protein n=1 Tax=Clostridium sp. DSM 8431 TaxID=1761781 RepID=UPI0008EE7D8A|nr:hypothetical protein [Clostridium sp. DSM 8431]SFU51987.1 hypothetical protein SAMN04487886_10471 [Clostridium sp. DSM 8431]
MIEKLFSDYIFLTKNILSGIKNGISVEEYFEKREKLIKDIIELDASKEDKKAEYESSGAKELDENVVEFIKNEMKDTKMQMQKAALNKRVYSSYVSSNVSGSFFRRTI